jgi:hypothetical protein
MMNSIDKDSSRLAALDAATAIVGGHLGVIEGCRRLSSLAHQLVPDWRVDSDFVVFGAVASDTDELPIGTVRQHWAPVALAREDLEIESAESFYRKSVISACNNVIDRFKDI